MKLGKLQISLLLLSLCSTTYAKPIDIYFQRYQKKIHSRMSIDYSASINEYYYQPYTDHETPDLPMA